MDELKPILAKISSDLESIKITAAVQTEQLKEHMKRSDLLEKRQDQIEKDLDPIKQHVTQVHTVFKVFGFVAIAVSLAKALKGLFFP